MYEVFESCVAWLKDHRRAEESFTANFAGEVSDFVRFNRSAVRQATAVEQRYLTVDWIKGKRHAVGELGLTGDIDIDRERVTGLVDRLREAANLAPPDPHLSVAESTEQSRRETPGHLPSMEELGDVVVSAAANHDLVGIWASGSIGRGFASSTGQLDWHQTRTFNFDWSMNQTAAGGEASAAKARYAGSDWSAEQTTQRIATSVESLTILREPSRTLAPGSYAAYLAPAALEELLGLLRWSSFAARAVHTRTTPLLRLVQGNSKLHPSVRLSENTVDGIAPFFQEAGFRRPPKVALVEAGAYQDCLVSPRSAMEYGLEPNGANDNETPLALDLGPGDLEQERILSALGTGLYISNFWYTNFSDRAWCRATGLTRFATFWVEGGKIVAPVATMRFDDTLYRLLGSELVGLTREREFLIDPGTYRQRSLASARLPGALVGAMALTL